VRLDRRLPSICIVRNVAERIRESVPEAKLIAILRNPVERVYGHQELWMLKAHLDDRDPAVELKKAG
jgi:hypothetical protein